MDSHFFSLSFASVCVTALGVLCYRTTMCVSAFGVSCKRECIMLNEKQKQNGYSFYLLSSSLVTLTTYMLLVKGYHEPSNIIRTGQPLARCSQIQ